MDKNISIHKRISRLKLDCFIKTNDFKYHTFYHGHEYVDLGLPSRTLWATCNVGAESETDFGNYYMYGKGGKVYNIHDMFYDGTEAALDQSADTATQVWGGGWHIPTKEQMEELILRTIRENVTINDIICTKFTGNNGNSVIFPICGYFYDGYHSSVGDIGFYWSSSPSTSIFGASSLFLDRIGTYGYCGVNNNARRYGLPVRPVLDSK